MNLSGKIALVTGASSGIGLAVTEKLVQSGARVAMAARRKAMLEEHVARLGSDRTAAFPIDVTDFDAVTALPGRVLAHFGALDILVNNAGLNHRGPIVQYSARALGDVITTNLTAPVVLTRAAVEREEFPHLHISTVCPGPVDTGFFGEISQVPDLVFSQPMSSAEQVADAILACIAGNKPEIALPRLSGALATMGYVFPSLATRLRPLLERRGAAAKARYAQRKTS